LEVLQGIPAVHGLLDRALQRLGEPDRVGGAAGDVDLFDLLVVLVLEVVDGNVDVVADVLDHARDAVHDAVGIAAAAAAAAAPAFAAHGGHPGRGTPLALGAHLVGVLGGHQDDRHVARVGFRLAASAAASARVAGS